MVVGICGLWIFFITPKKRNSICEHCKASASAMGTPFLTLDTHTTHGTNGIFTSTLRLGVKVQHQKETGLFLVVLFWGGLKFQTRLEDSGTYVWLFFLWYM